MASGEVQATEDGKIYKLKSGELILHAPMEFHSIKCEKEIPTNVLIFSLHINGELPNNLSKGVFYLTPDEQNEFKNIFNLIYEFYKKNERDCYSGIECVTNLTNFFIKLNRNHSVEKPLNHSQSARQYNNIVSLMTKKVCDNLTLEEIAKEENISVSYIKFLFNTYSGTTPKAYYLKLRCNEAIKLLSSGLSPTEAANFMNFSSPNYFSNFFKKMTGVSPQKYIQINK